MPHFGIFILWLLTCLLCYAKGRIDSDKLTASRKAHKERIYQDMLDVYHGTTKGGDECHREA